MQAVPVVEVHHPIKVKGLFIKYTRLAASRFVLFSWSLHARQATMRFDL
jgi:hypothetical protein